MYPSTYGFIGSIYLVYAVWPLATLRRYHWMPINTCFCFWFRRVEDPPALETLSHKWPFPLHEYNWALNDVDACMVSTSSIRIITSRVCCRAPSAVKSRKNTARSSFTKWREKSGKKEKNYDKLPRRITFALSICNNYWSRGFFRDTLRHQLANVIIINSYREMS